MKFKINFFALLIAALSFACSSCAKNNAETQPAGTNNTTDAQVLTDVAYAGKSNSQKMDIYIPQGAGPFPVVVLIHGGAFKAGSKSMESGHAAKLTANGYVAVSINYRLSGEAVFPAAVHDCKAAVRFLRANAQTYRINPDKIGAWGASAGGNLSAILGTSGGDTYLEGTEGNFLSASSNVQACIDWFGPINFATMVAEGAALGFASTYNVNNESQYLGLDANAPANIEIVKKANPTTYIDANDPPFWIEVGSSDPLIPYTQSLNFYNALKNTLGNGKVSYDMLEGAGHGGAQFDTDANLNKAVSFFDAKLK